MNLHRLKKSTKILHGFSTESRIHSRICMWTQNQGSGSDLASILIEFIRFFQNLINFRRTKNIFILGGFENFWMFWKAMSLNRSFLGFMIPADMIYRPRQRKREATFRKNPGWAPSPMCTTPHLVLGMAKVCCDARIDLRPPLHWYNFLGVCLIRSTLVVHSELLILLLNPEKQHCP